MDILEDLLQRIEKAEARLHELEDKIGRFLSEDWPRLGRALQAKVGTLEDPPEPKVKKEPLAALEGVECPNHPDADVTANGCTAKGCTYSPPAQPAQSA
jgi:hypothetical protein